MNYIKYFIISVFLICTVTSNAQGKSNKNQMKDVNILEISGYILDSSIQEGIFNYKVLVKYKKDSISMTKTNLIGFFSLKINISDSLSKYEICLTDSTQNYYYSKLTLNDFLKNNTINLTKKPFTYYNVPEKDLIICIYKNKRKKKWYQFLKK